eukprot:scaffold7420_cov28-Tisochrysis_lutea.AAC.6
MGTRARRQAGSFGKEFCFRSRVSPSARLRTSCGLWWVLRADGSSVEAVELHSHVSKWSGCVWMMAAEEKAGGRG